MSSSDRTTGKRNSAAASRRTFLRGAGVAMALPWLESIPVWGDTAAGANASASIAPKRFAAVFMGCGINAEHWTAKGSGKSMELGKSLGPMEPFKAKMNFVTGLFNVHATHVGIHPGQTGNILSGASLQKGRGAARRHQHGPGARQSFPRANGSAEHGSRLRATRHRLSRIQFLDGLQFAYFVAKRDVARADGGVPLAGVRQSV